MEKAQTRGHGCKWERLTCSRGLVQPWRLQVGAAHLKPWPRVATAASGSGTLEAVASCSHGYKCADARPWLP
eukprot:6186350-Pleurochrysis_carterae.AAC.5